MIFTLSLGISVPTPHSRRREPQDLKGIEERRSSERAAPDAEWCLSNMTIRKKNPKEEKSPAHADPLPWSLERFADRIKRFLLLRLHLFEPMAGRIFRDAAGKK